MSSSLRSLALLALATGFASIASAQVSGSGETTRYWDCCKGSCAWTGKADVSAPITTCDISDSPLTDAAAVSGCDGGTAYMCSDQSPWAVSDTLAYGFAAVSIPGGSESSWCCACYELTFTSTAIAGKKMIVQATNTGSDLADGQFDLAIPGGGVGIYNGCTAEWGAPSSGWGAQYGGISSDTCSTFPTALQPGCEFRFGDFFEGADNPTVDYVQVTCPAVLTDKTGCIRSGETPTTDSASSVASVASSTSAAVATSSSVSSVAAIATSSTSSAVVSSYSAPASSSSSSEAAPVVSSSAESTAASSTESVVASSAPASSAPVSSTSSEAAPVTASSTASAASYLSSAISFTHSHHSRNHTSPTGTGASVVAPVGTAASSGVVPTPSEDCQVEYVYQYE